MDPSVKSMIIQINVEHHNIKKLMLEIILKMDITNDITQHNVCIIYINLLKLL